jgi:hypothetical protein
MTNGLVVATRRPRTETSAPGVTHARRDTGDPQAVRLGTAASWEGVRASGWKGRSVALVIAASDDLETMAWSRTAAHGEVTSI